MGWRYAGFLYSKPVIAFTAAGGGNERAEVRQEFEQQIGRDQMALRATQSAGFSVIYCLIECFSRHIDYFNQTVQSEVFPFKI